MSNRKPMGFYDELVYEAVGNGVFEIDAEGRIWRLLRPQTSRWGHETKLVPCERRRAESPSGPYLHVVISVDGQRVSAFAHRLVWRHFKGLIPKGLTINHDDGRQRNNRPGNLELATHREQTLHAINVLGWKSYKNMLGKNSQPGERNAMAKLSEKAAREIRATPMVRGSGVALANKFGVATSVISRVRSGQLWGSV